MKLWINNHKKQMIAIGVILLLCVCGGVGTFVTFAGSKEETPEEKEEPVFTAEDISDVVTGLNETSYVLEGSDLDLYSLVTYDDAIVMGMAEQEDVNLSNTGYRNVEYEFLINANLLCSFLGRELPEIKKDLPTIGDGGVSTLCLWFSATKPIRVVDRVTAQVLADAGKVVYSGTNTTVARSDGQSVPLQEKLPASTTFTDRSSEVDVGTQDTHNWTVQSTEHHDAEGYLQAWDETIWGEKAQDVCNGCGYTDPNPNKVLEHCENACAGSGYSTQKVRTGTIHHEEWIEETAAYDLITYVCIGCGQTKTERKTY